MSPCFKSTDMNWIVLFRRSPLVSFLAGLLALNLLLFVLEHGADHRRPRLDLLGGAEVAGLNHHRPLRLPALVLGREFLLQPYFCISLPIWATGTIQALLVTVQWTVIEWNCWETKKVMKLSLYPLNSISFDKKITLGSDKIATVTG